MAAAADAVAAGSGGRPRAGEHCEVLIAQRATDIIQDCVQLHGGIGVTWEHDLHLFLRRITLYRGLFGTPSEHHQAIYRYVKNKGPAA